MRAQQSTQPAAHMGVIVYEKNDRILHGNCPVPAPSGNTILDPWTILLTKILCNYLLNQLEGLELVSGWSTAAGVFLDGFVRRRCASTSSLFNSGHESFEPDTPSSRIRP
jgi:hypothetical protein